MPQGGHCLASDSKLSFLSDAIARRYHVCGLLLMVFNMSMLLRYKPDDTSETLDTRHANVYNKHIDSGVSSIYFNHEPHAITAPLSRAARQFVWCIMKKYSKPNPLPSQEYLNSILSYDSETGKLTWKAREPEHFINQNGRSQEWRCRNWNSLNANRPAFTATTDSGYFHGTINKQKYRAHRIIWKMVYGVDPSGQIDHIDGNPQNNRLSNLRDVPNEVNSRNRAMVPHNTSGVTGVGWCKSKNKWVAQMTYKGRPVYLGRFNSFDDAVAARKAAEVKYGYHENNGRIKQ